MLNWLLTTGLRIVDHENYYNFLEWYALHNCDLCSPVSSHLEPSSCLENKVRPQIHHYLQYSNPPCREPLRFFFLRDSEPVVLPLVSILELPPLSVAHSCASKDLNITTFSVIEGGITPNNNYNGTDCQMKYKLANKYRKSFVKKESP